MKPSIEKRTQRCDQDHRGGSKELNLNMEANNWATAISPLPGTFQLEGLRQKQTSANGGAGF